MFKRHTCSDKKDVAIVSCILLCFGTGIQACMELFTFISMFQARTELTSLQTGVGTLGVVHCRNNSYFSYHVHVLGNASLLQYLLGGSLTMHTTLLP